MYVFPGIGLAAILCKAVSITQDMIYASGEGLSESFNEQEKADGWLYPDICRIREVSVVVTRAVIRAAQKNGVDRELNLRTCSDAELDEYIKDRMYDPFREKNKLLDEVDQLTRHANGINGVNGTAKAAANAHL